MRTDKWIAAGLLTLVAGAGVAAHGAAGDDAPVPPPDMRADAILIEKSAHRMTLLKNGQPFATYRVSLGRGGAEPKRREGDNLVPEGRYGIEGRNPRSAYHLALKISYPAPRDREAAAARGEQPGSNIMIHGVRNGLSWIGRLHRTLDWTAGCVAVTNAEMDGIWRAVPDGIPVDIRP